jgi:hypothetical protein
MRENKPQAHGAQERPRCQVGHVPGKPSSSCAEPAQVNVDGLVLCERNTVEVKLKGQISCWDEMLFHIDLWSREASRRERPDVVRLLDLERVKATSAMLRAYEDLDVIRSDLSRAK